MKSLLDQIDEAKGKIQRLLDGKGELTRKEELLVESLRDELASLRAEVVAEAQSVRAEAQSVRDLRLAEAQSVRDLRLAEAQSVRDLRLAELQRGEMLVCFTTVMLDEFNIDVEVILSHVCHLLIRNIESMKMLNQRLAFLRRRCFAQLNPV